MSSIGSEVGGKVGGSTSVDQTQYPFFTSTGGVTPQQSALADYDYGQNLLEGQAQFEGSGQGGGPSLSTMATQVAGGANMGKAIQSGAMSDTNQGAEYGSYQNAINIDQQNNENLLAQNDQNLTTSLSNLATQNGQAGLQAGLNAPTPGGSST